MTQFDTRLFIGGQFVDGQGQMESVSEPALDRPLAEVASASDGSVMLVAGFEFTRMIR